jgi:hypothetical protein
MIVGLAPGPNPTIVIYSASVVKIYNAIGSLVRSESKKMFYFTLRNTLAYHNAGCKFRNRRIGSWLKLHTDLEAQLDTLTFRWPRYLS